MANWKKGQLGHDTSWKRCIRWWVEGDTTYWSITFLFLVPLVSRAVWSSSAIACKRSGESLPFSLSIQQCHLLQCTPRRQVGAEDSLRVCRSSITGCQKTVADSPHKQATGLNLHTPLMVFGWKVQAQVLGGGVAEFAGRHPWVTASENCSHWCYLIHWWIKSLYDLTTP